MRTLTSDELRDNLSSLLDQVSDDHEPVIVTRAGGKPVVLVALEAYDAMDETDYLLASPANRDALLAAIADIEAGRTITKTLDELTAMEGE
jgi:antitoxin YefM